MNNYHLYSELGHGRGSIVYKGREKKTLQYVAIKSVEKRLKKRVLNEVSVLYSLNHPNILRFVQWYETSKHIWLILQYAPGGDLLSLLRADQSMPEYTVQLFAADLCAGLQAVHARGFLFTDLKPSNVLVDEHGALLLADFGLSRRIPQEPDPPGKEEGKRGSPYCQTHAHSHAQQLLQTSRPSLRPASTAIQLLMDMCVSWLPFAWFALAVLRSLTFLVDASDWRTDMAPELFFTGGAYSFASDLWALGALLYELATGRPPFFYAADSKHSTGGGGGGAALEEVVRRILEEEPEQLPQAAAHVRLAEGELEGEPHAASQCSATNPHGHSFSPAFQDFVTRLLCKDPARRLTWPELRDHPWWAMPPRGLGVVGATTLRPGFRLPDVELPEEPLFRQLYLSGEEDNHATNDEEGVEEQLDYPAADTHAVGRGLSSPLSPSLSGTLRASKGQAPDLLRLSMQARRNREQEEAAERHAQQAQQQYSREPAHDDLPTRSSHVSNHHQDVARVSRSSPLKQPQQQQQQQQQRDRASPPARSSDEDEYASDPFEELEEQASEKASSPPPQPHSANGVESGALDLADADTELDFSMRGPSDEVEDNDAAIAAALPPRGGAQVGNASRPTSSQQPRTFREPPRPLHPSTLDLMEAQLAEQLAREELEEEEERDDGYDDEEEETEQEQRGHADAGEQEEEEQQQPQSRLVHQHQQPFEDEVDAEWAEQEALYQAQQAEARRAAQQQQSQQHHRQHTEYDAHDDGYEDAVALNAHSGYADEHSDDDDYRDDADEEGAAADVDTTVEHASGGGQHRSHTPHAAGRSVFGSRLPVLASRLPTANSSSRPNSSVGPAPVKRSGGAKTSAASSLKPASSSSVGRSGSSTAASTASTSRSRSGSGSSKEGSSGSRKKGERVVAGAPSGSSVAAAGVARSRKPVVGSSSSSSSTKPSSSSSGGSVGPSGSRSALITTKPVVANSVKRSSAAAAASRPPATAESNSAGAAARRAAAAAAALSRAAAIHMDGNGGAGGGFGGDDAHEFAGGGFEGQMSPFHRQRQQAWQEQEQQQQQQQQQQRLPAQPRR